MAEDVVDGLEAIEIEAEHGNLGFLALGHLQGLADALVEQRAIGQIGQHVVMGEVLDDALRLA